MVSPTNTDTKFPELDAQMQRLTLNSTAAQVVRPVPQGSLYGTPRFGDEPSEIAQLTFQAIQDQLEALQKMGGTPKANKKAQAAQDHRAKSAEIFRQVCKTPERQLDKKSKAILRLTQTLVDRLSDVEREAINHEEAFALAQALYETPPRATYSAPAILAGRELHVSDHDVTIVPSPVNARKCNKGTANKIVRTALTLSRKKAQTPPTVTIHTLSSERPTTPEDYTSMKQEVENLQTLKGVPHVVQLASKPHEVGNRFSLVFDAYADDFFKLQEKMKSGEITALQGATLAYHTLLGLEGMHARRIVHLDIKPHNLFWRIIGGQAEAAIGDLGASVNMSPGKRQQLPASLKRNFYGSVIFTPPELFDRAAPKTFDALKKADVWALGLCLYEHFIIRNNDLPSWYGDLLAIYQNKQENDPRAFEPVLKAMHEMIEVQVAAYNAMDVRERTLEDRMTYVILEMLRMDPKQRSSASWARMNFEVILKNLEQEVAARLPAAVGAAAGAGAGK